jgi:hypothetical protein
MKNLFVLLLSLTISIPVFAQNTWPAIYVNPLLGSIPENIYEYYDGGYLLLSVTINEEGYVMGGWLVKTDANGEILWQRTLTEPYTDHAWYRMMQPTADSGTIVTFSTRHAEANPYGTFGDAAYMKLNACGELDWCKIISLPGRDNFPHDVVVVNDGYIGLYNNGYDGTTNYDYNANSLIKLDFDGNMIWMYNYDNDTLIDEELYDLLLLKDSTLLLTGHGTYRDTLLSKYFMKPIRLNIDLNGQLINYQVLNQHEDSIWLVFDNQSSQSARGTIYTSGQTHHLYNTLRKHKLLNPSPEIFILDTNKSYGYRHTWLQDSTIVVSGTSRTNFPFYLWHHELTLVDTLGNVLNRRRLLEDYMGPLYNVSTTTDNKILAAGKGPESTYGPGGPSIVFKLTSTLEDDVYDPTPRSYDYACPGGVEPNGTIGMEECQIIVNVENLARLPDMAVLEVFPNPVHDILQVRLPEYIVIRSSSQGLNTALYQSNYQQNSMLQVFDLNGTLVSEQALTREQLVAQFDATHWKPGMYLLRLVYKDKTVGSAKVVR